MRTNAVVLLMKMPSAADALISQQAITYGSAEPPVPPTTPCPDVNAESASIRIAGWLASALGASVGPAAAPKPMPKSVPDAMMAARANAHPRTRRSLRENWGDLLP